MARTWYRNNNATDDTGNNCFTEQIATSPFYHECQLTDPSPSGSSTITMPLKDSYMVGAYESVGDIGKTSIPAGTWYVNINVTAAAASGSYFDRVDICEITPAGANVKTIATWTGSVDIGSTGNKQIGVVIASPVSVTSTNHWYIQVSAYCNSHSGTSFTIDRTLTIVDTCSAGATVQFATTVAAATSTSTPQLLVQRQLDTTSAGATSTTSPQLLVQRQLTTSPSWASAAAAASLILSLPLATTSAWATSTSTPALDIKKQLTTTVAAATSTTSPSLLVARPLATTSAWTSATTSPQLGVQRQLATTSAWATTTSQPALSILAFELTQQAFRWRDNDGTETTASWLAALNTDPAAGLYPEVIYRLRFLIQETGGQAGGSGQVFTLWYRINAGSWTKYSTGTHVLGTTSQLAHNYDTTQQLGSGSFLSNNDAQRELSEGWTLPTNLAAGQEVEVEFSIVIDPQYVSNNDTIEFRVEYEDGTDFATYVNGPDTTINKPSYTRFEMTDWRWRADDGDEASATWHKAAHLPITLDQDVTYRLRVLIKERYGFGIYEVNTSGVNWHFRRLPSSWNTLRNDTIDVRLWTSQLVTGADTTQQLGSGSFCSDNDGQNEDDNNPDLKLLSANQEIEYECSFQVRSAGAFGNGSQLEFCAALEGAISFAPPKPSVPNGYADAWVGEYEACAGTIAGQATFFGDLTVIEGAIQLSTTVAMATTTTTPSLNIKSELATTSAWATSTTAPSLAIQRQIAVTSAGATTTSSPALDVSKKLATTVAGVTATTSPSLLVARPLAATSAWATSTTAPQLIRQYQGATTSAWASATSQPDLDVGGALIQFSTTSAWASSTSTASLIRQYQAAAASAWATSTTAPVLLFKRELTTTSAWASNTTAPVLLFKRQLTTTSAWQSSTSSPSLSIAGLVQFSTTVAGATATSTPSLSVARPVSTTSGWQTSTATASLIRQYQAATTSAWQTATTTAPLGVTAPLATTVSGVTTTSSPSLAVQRQLAAVAAWATSTATPPLGVQYQAATTSAWITSTSTPTLSTGKVLSTTVAWATGTTAPVLPVQRQVAATSAWASATNQPVLSIAGLIQLSTTSGWATSTTTPSLVLDWKFATTSAWATATASPQLTRGYEAATTPAWATTTTAPSLDVSVSLSTAVAASTSTSAPALLVARPLQAAAAWQTSTASPSLIRLYEAATTSAWQTSTASADLFVAAGLYTTIAWATTTTAPDLDLERGLLTTVPWSVDVAAPVLLVARPVMAASDWATVTVAPKLGRMLLDLTHVSAGAIQGTVVGEPQAESQRMVAVPVSKSTA